MSFKRNITIAVCIVAAAAGIAANLSAQSWKVGDKLPEFSSEASDGKIYTLATATKKAPAVFYFIMVGCPINDHAITYYKRIAEAYKGAKVPFIGVINTNADGFKKWNETFKVPFPVLLDPDQKLIKSWKVAKSPWIIVAGKDQKVVKEWNGYSSPALKELGDLIAKESGVKAKKCDFAGAPANLRPG